MWVVVLNKPNQDKFFRCFRGELMNVAICYDYDIELKDKSNGIARVVAEEDNTLVTAPKNLLYI